MLALALSGDAWTLLCEATQKSGLPLGGSLRRPGRSPLDSAAGCEPAALVRFALVGRAATARPARTPAWRAFLDERGEAFSHLRGRERLGEHREVDERQLPVEITLERASRAGRGLAHPPDRLDDRG